MPLRRALAAAALLVALGVGACRSDAGAAASGTAEARADSGGTAATAIRETFITPFDSADNVDGPAVWHGRDGSTGC